MSFPFNLQPFEVCQILAIWQMGIKLDLLPKKAAVNHTGTAKQDFLTALHQTALLLLLIEEKGSISFIDQNLRRGLLPRNQVKA